MSDGKIGTRKIIRHWKYSTFRMYLIMYCVYGANRMRRVIRGLTSAWGAVFWPLWRRRSPAYLFRNMQKLLDGMLVQYTMMVVCMYLLTHLRTNVRQMHGCRFFSFERLENMYSRCYETSQGHTCVSCTGKPELAEVEI